jgi:hypothetical protein
MSLQIYRPLPVVGNHQLVLKNLPVWDILAGPGSGVRAGVWQLEGGTNHAVCVNSINLVFLDVVQL